MDSIIGQIILCAFGYAPQNFLACDGSTLAVSEYQALYTLLGPKFGPKYDGNVSSTFNLPDLVGPTPSNLELGLPLQYYICVDGIWPARP